ncbi:MAG: hypothetical protein LIO92_08980 [Clostridiales bacterium]|nr:hypothetical protein [Clostridiales bacterium]
MREDSGNKVERILSIYSRLKEGSVIDKAKEIAGQGITERTLQRDIADIQAFLRNRINEKGEIQEIQYERSTGVYRLVTRTEKQLSSREILVVCQALLEGNSLEREELLPILYKLLNNCDEGWERERIREMITNEGEHCGK